MLKQQLDQDLKRALLAGKKDRVTTIRGLKSVILYAEVAKGIRDSGLSDEDILPLLAKEAKKRQESADLYTRGGSQKRADKELAEKKIIEEYLPKQLSDEELMSIIDQAIEGVSATGSQAMGQVIGLVKQRTTGQADGSRIAQIVKNKLQG